MTREAFIARWEAHLIGKLALGTSEFRHSLKDALTVGGVESTEALGRVLAKLPDEARILLGQLYDSAQPASPPVLNGQAARVTQKVQQP